MLKLIQSCSVVLSQSPHKLSSSNLQILSSNSEAFINKLQTINTPHLPVFLSSAYYLSIIHDLMRKKGLSKKIKSKVVDNAAKKGKSRHSWIFRYKSSAKTMRTMSLEDASCSKMTKEFKQSLTASGSSSEDDVTVLDSPIDQDVTILDPPIDDDVEVLYDSHSGSSGNQSPFKWKNRSETNFLRNDRTERNSDSSHRDHSSVESHYDSKCRFFKNDWNSWRKWSPKNDSSSSSWRSYSPKSEYEYSSWQNRFSKYDSGPSSWRSPSSTSDSESHPRRDLSADEIAEAAKKGRDKLEEIRSENYTKYGKELLRNGKSSKHKHNGFVFRVLSWNILSQKLLEQHRYLYSRSIVASLDWEYRKNQIINEIKDSKADILCLQEVEEESFHNLSALKDLGFKGLFKKRTHDKIDGCAIYYRSDKLRLKEFSFVEYFQPGVRLLDRDNIGIVAKFEPKSMEGTEFIVATTHLLYNPRRHDIKLVQMQLLLAEIERLSFSGAIRQNEQLVPIYYPCILTGDLNLLPQTGVYNLITKGQLKYDHLSSKNLVDVDLSHNHYQALPQYLLPPNLGITNKCQHDKVVSQRKLIRQPSEEERRLMQLYNSEKKTDYLSQIEDKNPEYTEEDLSNPNKTVSQSKYGSGVLSHNLKFKSVYTHEKDGKSEATTHQDMWITVDYIFYSPASSGNEETNLRLLSYQNLPSEEEARDHVDALPNLFCGSDHLPLVSSFFLVKS